ncbi:hypothetical protein JYU34_019735 [Plutella xylostella]|uniref:Major facilitator superfamily (MFS) profile domain-containing protein n=1 Tax=Plutella xylostella TaxID=51655 RepID=A0ABQ7PV72_PLUXY|nr:hypothetical protein JYU34_019735 [Plutella xylostella]
MAKDSPIPVDRDTASWIASSMVFGGWLGNIAGAYFLDKWGRKLSHILFIIPSVLGWLLIYFATNVPMLIIGRIAKGFSLLATYNIGLCVVAEYTAPEVRGLMFSLKTLSFVVSTLLTHLVGIYFHWRTVALIATVPLLASLGVTSSWPESPAWLLLRGERRRAGDAFRWLRGSGARAQREFQAMLQAQHERTLNTQTPKSVTDKMLHFFRWFTKREFVKPLIIYFALCVCLEGSGRHIIPVFSTSIMTEILPEKMDVSVYIISFDIISVIGNVMSCLIIKFLNRRTILFWSGFVSAAILSIFSLYGYLINVDVMTSRPWLLVSILVCYLMVSNVGISSLPLVISGEIFPLAIRETSTAVANFIALLFLFTVLRVTLILFNLLTVYGAFAVLAILLLISLIYMYYYLPETRNKSMQEIEDYFYYGRSYKRELTKDTDPEVEAMVCSVDVNKPL